MNEALSQEEVDVLIKGGILADEENGIFLKCKKCGVKHSINAECPLVDLWGDMFEEQGIPANKKLNLPLGKSEAKLEDFIYKKYPKDEKRCKDCIHLSECTFLPDVKLMCQAEVDAILRGVTDGELDEPEMLSAKETGWICPVCGRGNAPSVKQCNCK